MIGRAFLSLFLMSVITLGCAGPSVQLDKPPDIRYGEDMCDQCRMIISEARFAAAYVTSSGEVRRFDDIGGMLRFRAEHNEDVAVYWVHDYETEEWLKADQAYFVVSDGVQTPMGFGIVALGDRQRAQRLAEEKQGKVLTFEELLAQPPPSEPMEGMKGMEGMGDMEESSSERQDSSSEHEMKSQEGEMNSDSMSEQGGSGQ